MRSRPERLFVEELGDEWTPVLAAPLAHSLVSGRGGSVVMLDALSLESGLARWTSLRDSTGASMIPPALVAAAVHLCVLVEPPTPGARLGSVVTRVTEVSVSSHGELYLVDLVTPRPPGAGSQELTPRGKQLASIFTKGPSSL
jgi:hypothetical protein